MPMTGEALGWGALAASSLVIGALIGLARPWPRQAVGLVLGFGAGALISAVSFELAQEGVELGGTTAVAVGLGVGALTYYAAAGLVASRTQSAGAETGAGTALALGAFLDGCSPRSSSRTCPRPWAALARWKAPARADEG